ncbi:MAG TPA: prepilin-type N-terminal cleavage/methylation domain-containing protein [Phycisphaerae bacterium]|nr:prepilin-type N-terminal cleavage/methylation domain-containing protein [Phycisphaerae bacterium]
MRPRTGFTLVEILIVVIILGILAVIVLPEFSNASATARAAMLQDDLRLMRSQLIVFKAQHLGIAAGYPNGDPTQAPTESALTAHLTLASAADGRTAELGTPGFRFGPYLREIPENPINGKRTVRLLANGAAFPGTPQDVYGWIYQPSTLTLKADSSGADDNGIAFFDY